MYTPATTFTCDHGLNQYSFPAVFQLSWKGWQRMQLAFCFNISANGRCSRCCAAVPAALRAACAAHVRVAVDLWIRFRGFRFIFQGFVKSNKHYSEGMRPRFLLTLSLAVRARSVEQA